MNEFEEFKPDAAKWAASVLKTLKSQPTPGTLEEAIAPIRALSQEPDKDGDVWDEESFKLYMGAFEETLDGLISSLGLHGYESEYAKAIYAYTLEEPPIYRLCAKQMFSEDRRLEDGSLSTGVKAALTFYSLLTTALLSLPERFRHVGKAHRGVKYVYPSPTDHRVEEHFVAGRKILWFEPKSSSRNFAVMHKKQFCGLVGPRTVFTVLNPMTAFQIHEFSAYGPSEEEVLFAPLAVFEVVDSQKKWNQTKQEGFPDDVMLKQVPSKMFNIWDLLPGSGSKKLHASAAGASAPLPSTGSSQAAAASPPATAQVSVPSPAAPATGAGYSAAGAPSQAAAPSSAAPGGGYPATVDTPSQAATAAEQDAEEEEPWAGGEEWQREATFQGHANTVRALAALDAQTLASASEDHTVKLWDLAARRCTATLTGHTDKVYALCRLSGTALASGSQDKTVRVWDVPTSRCLATLQGHTDYVWATCRLAEQTLASGSIDGSVRVWDLRTSGCVATLTGHRDWVYALCVPSEGVVASGSKDTTVRLWEAAAGFRCRAMLEGHTDSVLALCPLTGGGLASGGWEGRVRFWEPGGARSLEVRAAGSAVWALCRLGAGAVASGGQDRHVRVWDSASGARLGQLDTGFPVYAVCGVQGAAALATSGFKDVCLWRGR